MTAPSEHEFHFAIVSKSDSRQAHPGFHTQLDARGLGPDLARVPRVRGAMSSEVIADVSGNSLKDVEKVLEQWRPLLEVTRYHSGMMGYRINSTDLKTFLARADVQKDAHCFIDSRV